MKQCHRLACAVWFAALAGVLVTARIWAGGVTVITHGLNGTTTGWPTGMAEAIVQHDSGRALDAPVYRIVVANNAGALVTSMSKVGGGNPATANSGEIIILLDWGDVADGNSFNTVQVAAAVALAFSATNFLADLGGRALAEWPLHFIGHSRGGSLVCELSRVLGTQGIWVDHVTTLDAHPLNNDGFNDFIYSATDAVTRTYENVLFGDSCYQTDSFVRGRAVDGAAWRRQTAFGGGYTDFFAGSHSDVHLWYHGTVDWATPVSDSEASLTASQRDTWWAAVETKGTNAGFLYSLMGQGDRLSTLQPNGANSSTIRAGFNQRFELGAGVANNRTALSSNSGDWPNVIKLDLITTNPVAHGESASLQIYFQWARPASLTQDVRVFLDADRNPLNGNERLVLAGTASGTTSNQVGSGTITLPIEAASAPAGDYNVFARLNANGRSRWLYTPTKLRVVASVAPPVLDIAPQADGVLVGINGVPGQTVILQASGDLNAWHPVATNVLNAARWEIPLSTGGVNAFYRAVLMP